MAHTEGKHAKASFPVGQYPGGRVLQVAYGLHTQGSNSEASDTLDICKLPGNALVLRAGVYVNGVRAENDDITVGYVGALDAFANVDNPSISGDGGDVTYVGMVQPVQLNSPKDVVVRLTSVGAADFPASAVIYALIEYVTDQPTP